MSALAFGLQPLEQGIPEPVRQACLQSVNSVIDMGVYKHSHPDIIYIITCGSYHSTALTLAFPFLMHV